MANLSRHYYLLISVQRSLTEVGFLPQIVEVDEPIDSNAGIAAVKSNLAKALGVGTDAIVLWMWWPLGQAAVPGKYLYSVTFINLRAKTQMQTNTYTIQIPLDSVAGMRAVLSQLPDLAPMFFQPLRPDPSSPFTFPDLRFSMN